MKDPREVARIKRCKRRRELILGGILGLIVSPFLIGGFFGFRIVRTHRILTSRRLEIPARDTHGFDPNALVTLMSATAYPRSYSIRPNGSGFAIGDGSLILTAAHCVDLNERKPKALSHHLYVASAYHGDLFPCEIVAVDPEADLALLRAPWTTHPGLALGSIPALKEGQPLWVASRSINDTTALQTASGSIPAEDRLSGQARMECLPVEEVLAAPQYSCIKLGSSRYVVGGWSGSPVLHPDPGCVAGLLVQVHKRRTLGLFTTRQAVAIGMPTIRHFLIQHRQTDPAFARPSILPSVPDSARAYEALRLFFLTFKQDTESAYGHIQLLADLRPDSVFAHLHTALIAKMLMRRAPDRASLQPVVEASLRRCESLVEYDPHGMAVLGDFLEEIDRHETAWDFHRKTLTRDPNNELALYNSYLHQRDRDPHRACGLARELVTRHPGIGDFWRHYSDSLYRLKRYEQAVDAARQALATDPDGLFGRFLARALAKTGQCDEARDRYQDMTRDCGCQECWLAYANFLLQHADRYDDALPLAEQAIDAMEASKKTRNLGDRRHKIKRKLIKTRLAQQPDRADHWYVYARYLIQHDPDNQADIDEALQKAGDPNRSHPVPVEDLARLRQEIEESEPVPAHAEPGTRVIR